MESREPRARRPFQMGLGMLLYLVLVIALGLGWYQDHQRLEDAQVQMPLEKRLVRDQLEAMQGWIEVEAIKSMEGFLSTLTMSRRLTFKSYQKRPDLVNPFLWNAEQFMELLALIPIPELSEAIPPDQQMQGFLCQVQFAPDDVYRELMPKLLAFFDSPEIDTRRGMVFAMRRQLIDSPDRIAPFRAKVLGNIVARLNDSDATVIHEAILAVGEIGLEARAAAPRLQTLADDEQNWQALMALCQIDPSTENIERIEDWIFERKPDWESVVADLEKVMTLDEGIEFLRKAYAKSVFPADQKILAEQINVLEVHRLTELRKQPKSDGKKEQR